MAVSSQPASELRVGDRLDLEPTSMAHGGIAVARHEGRVVFVGDTIPGERVRVRVTEIKKGFARAVATEVLEASPHRVPHVWREADIDVTPDDRPGGAEFGHIELAHQRELKAEVLRDAMARFGGVEVETAVAALPGDDENGGTRWRTRVTLHVDRKGRVGPMASRSHRVIPVAGLPLAVADIEELAPLNGAVGGKALEGPGRIDLVAPAEYDTRMRVRVRGTKPRAAAVIRERVGALEFQVAEDGFWQIHHHAAPTLAREVRALAADRLDPQAAHLDLYGGVGLFAAVLAEAGATRVETVEAAAPATGFARTNLAAWRDASAITASVDDYLRGLEGSLDAAGRAALGAGTIVLDPPRAGAGREVSEAVARLHPAQLIYVACDPVALARDTATLAAAGYRLDELRAFDLFPNTHHLECVARFLPEGTA